MLAKRIIPCLDVDRGRVVKGIKFLELQDAGDPIEQARRYDREGADELVFLDITASSDRRDIVREMVRKVADSVFIPFTVGGGIRTIEDMREILASGADKISINTAAIDNPALIASGASSFGSQAIVVAIDARKTSRQREGNRGQGMEGSEMGNRGGGRGASDEGEAGGSWEVYSHGGRIATGIDVVEWAVQVEKLGAGEILLTSMDCDGTRDGYDLGLTRAVAEAVSIPVIASGGAGTLEHLAEALEEGKASAVLAASIFHYGEFTITQAKELLRARGLPVRITAPTLEPSNERRQVTHDR